nr:pentatricopeptide repeat-containing protein At4g04370 [Ipomoea batatas]
MNKLSPNRFHPPLSSLQSTTPAGAGAATTTRSVNATINRLSSEGSHHQVLLTYASMLKASIPGDNFTYPSLLKACTSLNLFRLGLSVHQHVLVNGYFSDPYIASSLISFYSKLGHTENAHNLFDKMHERSIVPWTAIIGCYARSGDICNALSLYNSMQQDGIKPCAITVLTLLSGVTESNQVRCFHSSIVKYGFTSNLVLMNCMLSLYSKCERVGCARDLFESMHEKDIVSWNSLISGYVLEGNTKEILRLMHRMRFEGLDPDSQTYGSLVSAISKEGSFEIGGLVHGQIIAKGFESDVHLETSLIVMYLKCGNLEDAFNIFEKAKNKDAVLWTSVISGLVQNEYANKALEVFRWMLDSRTTPSTSTLASVLAACSQLGLLKVGTSIHCYILRQRIVIDSPAQNSLVTMYSKCGYLKQSLAIFHMIEKKDVVSWNAIVAGHAQNGHLSMALHMFNEMRITHQKPDSITIVSLLQACASTGAFQQGKWIHNFVMRSCLGPCIMIDTALVDMYCKCGDLNAARKCFDRMLERDLVSWSTIIAGYGSHGEGKIALELYSKLVESGAIPNSVVFLTVLYACSHNGLVEQGMSLFESMRNDFKIEPELEHCACIVDLLCRAGRVKEAYGFYTTMFPEPMVDALGIILDSCRGKGLVELGDVIAKEISVLEPDDAGKYVQLAHSYASNTQWEGVGKAWLQMKSLGLKKLPGWSFIDLQGNITTFFMGHSSHPQHDDIVCVLKNLSKESRELVFMPDLEFCD